MKRSHREKITIKITALVVILLIVSAVGLYGGVRYVNHRLLQSNKNMATDIAQLIGNNFQITDEEVAYMKSLSFNDMEIDPINQRLMDVENGLLLTTKISNIYLLAPLSKDEVRYTVQGDAAEFFGYEDGTALDGIWLLNGTFNKDGQFVATQRDDIYRYTALTTEQAEALHNQKSYGEYTSDAWGNFVTGYVPIYTAEGNFVGLLGVDMDPDQFQESARRMALVVIFSFAIAIITMTVLFLWFYLKYTRNNEREQEEKEVKYTRQIEAMADVDEESLIAKGRHNLTKNLTELYCTHQKFAVPLSEDG